ncbi:MAG: hypothetical protein Q7S23_02115 [bacterium]|nr:hypothetical protein [bacterium]
MRPAWYNLLVLIGTAGAWASWWSVVTNIEPASGNPAALAYFFSTLFFSLMGTIYFGAYFLQMRLIGRQAPIQCVRASTRQAVLFTTLVCASLLLQGWRLLTWFNAVLLIALLTFIELMFISRQRHPVVAGEWRRP